MLSSQSQESSLPSPRSLGSSSPPSLPGLDLPVDQGEIEISHENERAQQGGRDSGDPQQNQIEVTDGLLKRKRSEDEGDEDPKPRDERDWSSISESGRPRRRRRRRSEDDAQDYGTESSDDDEAMSDVARFRRRPSETRRDSASEAATSKSARTAASSIDSSPSPDAPESPPIPAFSVVRGSCGTKVLKCTSSDPKPSCAALTFDRPCEYRKHMDKHNRPHVCLEPSCKNLKGFTYAGGLLRHQREVHDLAGGVKNMLYCPFPHCKRHDGARGFSRRENLNEHLKRLHHVFRTEDGELLVLGTDDTGGSTATTTGPPQSFRRSLPTSTDSLSTPALSSLAAAAAAAGSDVPMITTSTHKANRNLQSEISSMNRAEEKKGSLRRLQQKSVQNSPTTRDVAEPVTNTAGTRPAIDAPRNSRSPSDPTLFKMGSARPQEVSRQEIQVAHAREQREMAAERAFSMPSASAWPSPKIATAKISVTPAANRPTNDKGSLSVSSPARNEEFQNAKDRRHTGGDDDEAVARVVLRPFLRPSSHQASSSPSPQASPTSRQLRVQERRPTDPVSPRSLPKTLSEDTPAPAGGSSGWRNGPTLFKYLIDQQDESRQQKQDAFLPTSKIADSSPLLRFPESVLKTATSALPESASITGMKETPHQSSQALGAALSNQAQSPPLSPFTSKMEGNLMRKNRDQNRDQNDIEIERTIEGELAAEVEMREQVEQKDQDRESERGRGEQERQSQPNQNEEIKFLRSRVALLENALRVLTTPGLPGSYAFAHVSSTASSPATFAAISGPSGSGSIDIQKATQLVLGTRQEGEVKGKPAGDVLEEQRDSKGR